MLPGFFQLRWAWFESDAFYTEIAGFDSPLTLE